MIEIRSAIAFIAATTSGATEKSSCAANRAARIIRSGSSLNEISGAAGVRITSAGQVGQPAVRVVELLVRQRDAPSR